jgi:hypothetical protein
MKAALISLGILILFLFLCAPVEGFGSDWNTTVWGTSLWNGWRYGSAPPRHAPPPETTT